MEWIALHDKGSSDLYQLPDNSEGSEMHERVLYVRDI
jgi:hypothetical protein